MSFFEKLIENTLYPKHFRCVSCNREAVLDHRYLCQDCAQGLERITSCCPCCGRSNNGTLCDDCAKERYFLKTTAPFKYISGAKGMVRALKYKNCVFLAPIMAADMAPMCDFDNIDLVTSVPARRSSFARRGYNQSSYLAYYLSKIINLPFEHLLAFGGNTRSQHLLAKNQRRFNYVDSIFCIKDISGKSMLLVDDILTTGSTANACAKALIKCGASAVYVAVFATVPFLKKIPHEKEAHQEATAKVNGLKTK